MKKRTTYLLVALVTIGLDTDSTASYYLGAKIIMGGNNSVVECNLAKVEVAGSNPVSRSRQFIKTGSHCCPFFVQENFYMHPRRRLLTLAILFFSLAFHSLFPCTAVPPCQAAAVDSPSKVSTTASGQIDMCLSCHDERPDRAHGRKVLGCFSCHLGNPLTGSAKLAHKGMVLNPGELYIVSKTCGQEGCHTDQVKRVKKSLMATNRGIISTLRYYWNESKDHDADLTVEKLLKSDLDTPAIDYYRKLCGTCHLWLKKHTLPGFLAEKGGGCTTCHFYKPGVGKDGKKTNHPLITKHIPMKNCIRCHNRSGRIGIAYKGIYEAEGYGTPFEDGDVSEGQLSDGRYIKRLEPDIHFKKGLICIDCHNQKEIMGDGNEKAHFEEQLEITCTTCHDGRQRLEKIFEEDIKRPKYPLLTNLVKKNGNFFLKGKKDQKLHPLHRFLDTACRHPVHERLACQACHSKWVPQCYGCHVVSDKSKDQLDKLSNKQTPGRWEEFRSFMRYEVPSLGIKKDYKTRQDKVVIIVPG